MEVKNKKKKDFVVSAIFYSFFLPTHIPHQQLPLIYDHTVVFLSPFLKTYPNPNLLVVFVHL